ncbi:hypothetical protein P9112_002987 [Eukaryota sp. TZLM1-RC]
MNMSSSQPINVQLNQTPSCCAINASTSSAVFGYPDGSVCLYQRSGETFSPTMPMNIESVPICLSLAEDAIIVGTSADVKILPFGGEITPLEMDKPVTTLTHSCKQVFFGTCDGKVGCFSRESVKNITSIPILFGSVVSLSYSNNHLYALGSDGICYDITLEDGALEVQHQFETKSNSTPFCIGSNASFIAVTSEDGTCFVWDCVSKQKIGELKVAMYSKVAVTNCSELLFVSADESSVYVFSEGSFIKQ